MAVNGACLLTIHLQTSSQQHLSIMLRLIRADVRIAAPMIHHTLRTQPAAAQHVASVKQAIEDVRKAVTVEPAPACK